MSHMIRYEEPATPQTCADAAKELGGALHHLAHTFLAAMANTAPNPRTGWAQTESAPMLAKTLLPDLELRPIRCGHFRVPATASWDAGEMHQLLCRSAVLAGALQSQTLAGKRVFSVRPAGRVRFDANGIDSATGKPWFLEAFGGRSLSHNVHQYKKDTVGLMAALCGNAGARAFFACLKEAKGQPPPACFHHAHSVYSFALELVDTHAGVNLYEVS